MEGEVWKLPQFVYVHVDDGIDGIFMAPRRGVFPDLCSAWLVWEAVGIQGPVPLCGEGML